ncbi:hypothetical protein BH24ACT3_BH24ACT3_10720 [soil metagenome]
MVALVAMLAPAGAGATPTFASTDDATVHPGVQTFTDGAQCTANFVFIDGTDVFIGQAAHCSGTGGSTETNGCDAGSLPLGTEVEVDGAEQPGTLVYNSWLTMQAVGETDPDACQYNDFALIRVHPDDVANTNPSIPVYGGPVALGTATSFGETVYSYGNSSLRLGLEPLSPKTGTSLGQTADGWNHPVYTVTPGVPGDSGSAFLNSAGEAIGVLSTLAIAPLAGSNGVSDLNLAVTYMQANSPFSGVDLVPGTEPFTPSLVGLVPLG